MSESSFVFSSILKALVWCSQGIGNILIPLRDIFPCSVKEILWTLSISQTAVTSLLSKVYKKLAKILEKQGFNYKSYEKASFARCHLRAFLQGTQKIAKPRMLTNMPNISRAL
jgi:hypothetical protein